MSDLDLKKSQYLTYLPAIFEQTTGDEKTPFIGRFLLAFEQILSGLGLEQADKRGLEELIEQIHTYFDPAQTPTEFLPWLAQWVAYSLREDWTEDQQRRFIQKAAVFYRTRGTKEGMIKMLREYTGIGLSSEQDNGSKTSDEESEQKKENTSTLEKESGIRILEFKNHIQVLQDAYALNEEERTTVGVNTMIGGGPPHYFLVEMYLLDWEQQKLWHHVRSIKAIIDQQKPAHSYYDLEIEIPSLQIRVHSTIGVDTLIGKGEFVTLEDR